jgi:hypothetical protein
LILSLSNPLFARIIGGFLGVLGPVAGDGQRQTVRFLPVINLDDARIVPGNAGSKRKCFRLA